MNYTIDHLSNIADVNKITIRSWEERHDFIIPKRSKTNIRYYELDDLICIINVCSVETSNKKLWFESGLQLSNLISTIALTYTLLGISLGIGELSISKLDISSINQTIGKLTNKFSMAFFTSVIGLPLSSIFRAILIIIFERINIQKTDFLLENRIINRSTK